uniref:Uncharacterized protein n=1 Tax=Arundo donax TaxID=35708 RepID=A0A0A8Y936_ARUDO
MAVFLFTWVLGITTRYHNLKSNSCNGFEYDIPTVSVTSQLMQCGITHAMREALGNLSYVRSSYQDTILQLPWKLL